MPEKYKNHDVTLKDLLNINVQQWQKIQENFSDIAGINLRIVSPEGTVLASSNNIPRLCSDLLRDSSAKERICGSCLPTFLYGKAIVDKNLSFVCDMGLYNFISPLTLNKDKILGYLIMGPVILVMRKPKEEYATIAQECSIELDDFWHALLEIKIISFHCAQSLVELIGNVTEHILQLAYENLQRREDAHTAEGDTSKTGRLLEALLDVAFEISKADVGSVMFLDRLSNELTIQISRGIPENIAKNARIRLGNGIAGLAAKEGKPLLIDKSTQDNRIIPYLQRPQLGSSMIIPLKAEKRVVGVMNVGVLNISPIRYNQETMNLMNKLADLATTAIQPP